jgi:anti-sigma B factor antagonist
MILQLQKSQPEPDLCVVEFSGKLLMGNESRQVEKIVGELLNAGVKRLIFEFSKLDTIDSTGVGIIVMSEGKMKKAGGELRVAGATGVVNDALTLTHVDRLVRIFPSLDEAMRNFQGA